MLNLGTGAPDRGVSRAQQGWTGDLLYFVLYGTLYCLLQKGGCMYGPLIA